MTRSSSPKITRIGILGGGPAGLSMAKMLIEKGGVEPVVLELTDRIGGKSHTIESATLVAELGTCYATFGHKQTNRWMRELGIPKNRLGKQHYDGGDFVDYVKKGGGSHLLVQVLKYSWLRRKLLKETDSGKATAARNAESALPVKDWLDRHKLHKIERFMHRALSSMGYGYVDTTSTLQALRWCDWDLMLSGVINSLRGPIAGWHDFWVQLSAAFEVRLNFRTAKITRNVEGIEVQSSEGEILQFDYLISTIPPDEFNQLVQPTTDELVIAESIEWVGYSSALIAVDDWFTEWQTEGFSASAFGADREAKIAAARFEGHHPDLGGNIYFVGHALYGYTPDEYREILEAELRGKGARLRSVLYHQNWKYFPRYKREMIENGLVATMVAMQGEQRTFHTGAAFSHESVSNITRFNQRLIQSRILPAIKATKR